MNAVDGVSFEQSLCDSENTLVGRLFQSVFKLGKVALVIADETVHALTDHAESLLDDFFECTSDSHHLAD